MHLPDKEQVDFLRANLDDVKPELEAAVAHKNPDIRMRAAYVISEIGSGADGLGECLFEQLKKEPEQLVQIYLIDALGAMRFGSEEIVIFLKEKYNSLSDENVSPNLFGGIYAQVDEKIKLAGVLYVLSKPEFQGQYLDFVTKWLRPPGDNMTPLKTGGYWERRWMAVNSLEQMGGASEAIPLLEKMLTEEKAKPWVSIHVPRVLKTLRASGA